MHQNFITKTTYVNIIFGAKVLNYMCVRKFLILIFITEKNKKINFQNSNL
jgi:hypothetical protein